MKSNVYKPIPYDNLSLFQIYKTNTLQLLFLTNLFVCDHNTKKKHRNALSILLLCFSDIIVGTLIAGAIFYLCFYLSPDYNVAQQYNVPESVIIFACFIFASVLRATDLGTVTKNLKKSGFLLGV